MDNRLDSESASADEASERSAQLTHQFFRVIDPEMERVGDGAVSVDEAFNVIINALAGVTAAVLTSLPPDLDVEAVQRSLNERVTAIISALDLPARSAPRRRSPTVH
jgi:hypothetical protein